MSDRPVDYGREVRDTIVKSSLTGVAATAMVVAALSPAGLGGMVGTSVASGLGLNTAAAPSLDDPYAHLPAFPAPLTRDEVVEISGELARATASLEITRAATEAKIEHIRSIALNGAATSYTPQPTQTAQASESLRLATTAPASFTPPAPAPTVPAPVEIESTPVNYSGGAIDTSVSYRDRDLELADLLLAHETF